MSKLFIQNRKNQKIAVIVEQAAEQKGLAFVIHGLGGFKEQPHIQTIADVFAAHDYSVVRFDTTNTLGESDGDMADATMTNYFQDLEDVIAWARTQAWYQEPFVVAGHSLGAMCVALFAEKNPEKVKAVAPVSTVVSGALILEAQKQREPEVVKEWEKTGWLAKESNSKPGVIRHLKWDHVLDRLQYDLLPEAGKLIMPVLLVVGELDESTPLEQQKIFYNALPMGAKELYIIKSAPHTFRDKAHLEEIRAIFDRWLKKLA